MENLVILLLGIDNRDPGMLHLGERMVLRASLDRYL